MNQWFPFLVSGLVTGSIISIAALGLVLSYKTSGLLNFGHGALAAAGAYVFFDISERHHVSWPLAAAISVGLFGAVAGLLMERLSRGLAAAPTAYRVVATVGLLVALRQAAVIRYGASARTVPHFLPTASHQVAGVFISAEDYIIAGIAALSAVGLYAFFRVTRLGRAMRAVVDDPSLLDLTGTDPVRVRRSAWILACSFAALSGVLFAPVVVLDSTILTLLIVQAFGAAVFGGFSSLPAVYAGGLLIGVLQGLSTKLASSHPALSGLPPSVPFLALVLVLIAAGPKLKEVASARRDSLRLPERLERRVATPAVAAAGLCLTLVPFVVGTKLPVWSSAMGQATLFLSLALLVRLSGQVSLCQLTFAAVGAASFGHLAGALGVPWLPALVLAGVAAVPFGAAVAIPAIRLSGMYLALATLGFGILVQQLLLRRWFLFGSGGHVLHMPRPHILLLGTDKGFYFVLLASFGLAAAAVVWIERSRLGRLLRGLADSPLALQTNGANVNITRVIVFCISAFLAGISGALVSQLAGTVTADSYQPLDSLILIAVLAVVSRRTIPAALLASGAFIVVPAYINNATLSEYLPLLFGVAAILAALSTSDRVRIAVPAALTRSSEARTGSRLRARPRLGPAWSAATVSEELT